MFIHGFADLELRARVTGERRLSNLPGRAWALGDHVPEPAESAESVPSITALSIHTVIQ